MKIGTKSLKFEDVKNDILKDQEVKKLYDEMQDEFNLIISLIEARQEANLTQAQVAEKMGVKQSAVARIESGSLNLKYGTICNYLKACGKKIANFNLVSLNAIKA
ncbi:helix-turn-helix domain-containing protein [Campylobacter sp. JMF_01 NE2]|uniref:helix-turn-helix domain-containing protein n=1 Tax=unclassified Campylobacter TaxID=2593542 RepID=UPI0022E9C255|nr:MULTISPECIES: helix-turn-helix transcriptional regulator [unclassified Campylobacter]MDA3052566.1 helix-turn-helix domain-containing protein [Campylobacter sp. JMF_03 NE3]MDA3066898.1 helix-turn-helix domain-containing protein [Campylobacter sp. JMF_01 NE2]